MNNFLKLGGSVDTSALSVALQLQPGLWNAHAERKEYANSPHKAASDIWLRYNDLDNLKDGYKKFTEQHDSVWHPAAKMLPQVRDIVFDLMARCEAERLGGILITKIPAGQRVLPHIDRGWHPEYYNVKLYVPLQSNERCVNRVEDERVVMRVGEVWYFDNTKEHEVINDGDTDRVTLIICLRSDSIPGKQLTVAEANIRHHFSAGVYAKEMSLPRGRSVETHSHAYEHMSLLGAGVALIEGDGIAPITYHAPACIVIPAKKKHKITAIEDVTWYCIHATEETDVKKIDALATEK